MRGGRTTTTRAAAIAGGGALRRAVVAFFLSSSRCGGAKIAPRRGVVATLATLKGRDDDDGGEEEEEEEKKKEEAALRERWTTAYAVAVRDAFAAKTARKEEEPAFRAVVSVKDALTKETTFLTREEQESRQQKKKKKKKKKKTRNVFALSSLACRVVLTAELSFAQNEDEVTRVLNLAKKLADAKASSTHVARLLAMEALRAGVPARAVETSSVGEKLLMSPSSTRNFDGKKEDGEEKGNDILWSLTFPSEKLLSSAEEIRNEMQRKGYVVVDGVLGETNSKIAEEAAMNLYESEKTKFKSGELARDNNREKNATMKKKEKYRDDEITWLSGDENEDALSALSQFLRDTLGSIIFEIFTKDKGKKILLRPEEYHSNAMLSVYSSNRGGFAKHLDHDDATDPRKISAVYYLNSNWNEKENGGALLLYPDKVDDDDAKAVRVNPIRDRLVLFWSDQMYHAVEPSNKQRFACSFWYL